VYVCACARARAHACGCVCKIPQDEGWLEPFEQVTVNECYSEVLNSVEIFAYKFLIVRIGAS
jgi:hypothetical protein